MRAILRTEFGGPEVLVIREMPEPEPKDGHVVIEVKAFGLNHAELHMRKGEWAEIADVSGIECVGVVKSCPGGEFPVGAKVAALMGGLGRTINGSYAEYTRAPVSNVALIECGLAVGGTRRDPRNLCHRLDLPVPQSGNPTWPIAGHPRGDLVVRSGGAQNGGQRRRPGDRDDPQPRTLRRCWRSWGLSRARSSGRICRSRSPRRRRSTRCSTWSATASILDSLAMLRRGGRSCLAGWLGGLDPIPDFNPLLQMASGVYLTFFGSFVFGTPGFPLSDVPLQQIAADAAAGRLDVKPVRVFRFEEIQEAHRVMEANQAGGKMVVVHD